MAGLNMRTSPKVYKILVVGEKGVGKTKIIDQFILNTFVEDYDGLIWTNYRKQIVLDNRVAFLDVSDTITPSDAEMEDYLRAGWEHQIPCRYCAAGDGEVDEVVGGARESKKARPIQIVLVGNKSDLNSGREVTVKEGIELAKSFRCSFVETSAKEGYNIVKALHDLIRAVDKGAADEQQCGDKGSAAAVAGFRSRLGRLARSLRLKKN
ncbi:hypothetical protein GMDG_05259 [Pseudogymnoascus destructans 20631-21]|uniref:Uncharacterized protein n=1 Tax=Pseudogymnoascus destructans (strain ATCC MYA-4855 / 20631-21) TaxID=658429 RepID=L8FNK0_PSED2|nr:hypothetical protein GMDG_05259 [Pseudogymnoascus destructans 20631-21]